jgi:hypothetical protein
MRARESDSILLFPLLPIFLVGMFPMLMMALLGFAGLGLLGILLISAALTDALDANNDFNQHIVVEGYARRTERAIYASNLHSAMRSATAIIIAGIVLILTSIGGLIYSGS